MVPDVNHGYALRNEPIGGENLAMTSANVEIVVPQAYLGHVYGENCSNLNYIKQVRCNSSRNFLRRTIVLKGMNLNVVCKLDTNR